MKLAPPLNIRLTQEQQFKYESEAAAKSIPLVKYIRQRLEMSDNILTEIHNLTAKLSNVAELLSNKDTLSNGQNEDDFDSNQYKSDNDKIIREDLNHAILVELLLIIRQSAQPQASNIAQAEVRRQGMQIWTGKNRV